MKKMVELQSFYETTCTFVSIQSTLYVHTDHLLYVSLKQCSCEFVFCLHWIQSDKILFDVLHNEHGVTLGTDNDCFF